MKKKKISILVITCVIIVTGVLGYKTLVSAGSTTPPIGTYSTGKAVIPHFGEANNTSTGFTVTNITDNPINVTVTLYNNDGTMLVDDNSATTGIITSGQPDQLLNYCDQSTNSSATFTINAHCTGKLLLSTTTVSRTGYGIIQWTQNTGNTLQGLVVSGFQFINSGTDQATVLPIDVNGGLPF